MLVLSFHLIVILHFVFPVVPRTLNSIFETNGTKYVQVLWNSSCLDSLLFSVQNDTPTVVNDPAWEAVVRSLYQKIVREWIVISLSYAPCTTQGLLQVSDCMIMFFTLLLFILPPLWICGSCMVNVYYFPCALSFEHSLSFTTRMPCLGPFLFNENWTYLKFYIYRSTYCVIGLNKFQLWSFWWFFLIV